MIAGIILGLIVGFCIGVIVMFSIASNPNNDDLFATIVTNRNNRNRLRGGDESKDINL